MLQISVSKIKCFHESDALHYRKIDLDNFDEIIPHITKTHYPWSPNIFSDEYRHGLSFCRCDLLVFDYDSGNPTLNEAIESYCSLGYRFIIGTTKSHQKEKKVKKSQTVHPPCDRFRVVILADGFADNIMQFNYQMRRVSNHFTGIDSSCAEGARFYWACKEIVCNSPGKPYIAPKPKSIEVIKRKIEQLKKDDYELGRCGYVPSEILAFIKYGAVQGERRPSLFKYGARLTRLGWQENKVISVLLEAPFYKEDLKIDDMMRQIERGILYGKGYEGYAI